MGSLSPEEQLKLIKKGVLEIISEEELLEKLKEGLQPLIFTSGIQFFFRNLELFNRLDILFTLL